MARRPQRRRPRPLQNVDLANRRLKPSSHRLWRGGRPRPPNRACLTGLEARRHTFAGYQFPSATSRYCVRVDVHARPTANSASDLRKFRRCRCARQNVHRHISLRRKQAPGTTRGYYRNHSGAGPKGVHRRPVGGARKARHLTDRPHEFFGRRVSLWLSSRPTCRWADRELP